MHFYFYFLENLPTIVVWIEFVNQKPENILKTISEFEYHFL